ncbi:MAG: LPS export ABC transporter permease LptG [Alphaproteobacteria bacterium]
MNWSWTLNFYLARRFLNAVMIVFGALVLMAFSIDLVELFNRTPNRDVAPATVVGMSLLKLGNLALKLLPFAILFGSILAFSNLARSHELVATRAAGVSAWSVLVPPLAVAIGLGVLSMTTLNPAAASLLSQYERLEAKYIRGQASQLSVFKTGLWLRQGDSKRQSVIHALRASEQGANLEDVTIFLYEGQDKFVGRIDARRAQLKKMYWLLENAWVSGPAGAPKNFAAYNLPTDLTRTQIQESFSSPDTIPFWELPRFIANAEEAGFATLRHKLYWYSLLVLPVLFSAMVFMAASFSLRLTRLGGFPQLVIAGALSGFAVYFLNDVTQALGTTGILPAPLAAVAPAAMAILVGMTLLFHQEDG